MSLCANGTNRSFSFAKSSRAAPTKATAYRWLASPVCLRKFSIAPKRFSLTWKVPAVQRQNENREEENPRNRYRNRKSCSWICYEMDGSGPCACWNRFRSVPGYAYTTGRSKVQLQLPPAVKRHEFHIGEIIPIKLAFSPRAIEGNRPYLAQFSFSSRSRGSQTGAPCGITFRQQVSKRQRPAVRASSIAPQNSSAEMPRLISVKRGSVSALCAG